MTACAVWDLTIPAKEVDFETLRDEFRKISKKWAFQKKAGSETGYLHYQCRISLAKRKRENQVVDMFKKWKAHVTPTSTQNMGNQFYVLKDDTRVEGPWSDADDVKVPARWAMDPVWKPWQAKVIEICKTDPDDRTVNVIVDTTGNNGKSFLANWLSCRKLANQMPPLEHPADVSAAIMCREEVARTQFIDLPRAMPKKNLNALYTAIEMIKTGYVCDKRYSFKEKWIDPVHVWVFTNVMPNKTLLSIDRWKFWQISSDMDLTAMPGNF